MADCTCSPDTIASDAQRVAAALARSERANFDAHSDRHADRVMNAVRRLRACPHMQPTDRPCGDLHPPLATPPEGHRPWG